MSSTNKLKGGLLKEGPIMKRVLIVISVISIFLNWSAAISAEGPGRLIQPNDLEYRGAFRLPDGPPEIGWEWSGEGMTYFPGGDPKGPDDGHPGSLFGVGHNWNQYVSEISIPRPVFSRKKILMELPTATTLQKFCDIKGNLYEELEQPRMGLVYLPKQGGQERDKLYFCRAHHLNEGQKDSSHGWCDLDLSNPKSAGPWRIGDLTNYHTSDFIFRIPKEWADKNTPGMLLATGRYRDGGQASQGPSIYAFSPWKHGNPPPKGAVLKAVTLLEYSNVTEGNQRKIKNYHHSDDWSGAAWLTAGRKSAVILVGTKGHGKCWYGYANGLVWPDKPPYPPVPPWPNDDRGWWSTTFTAQFIFFDPNEIAAVVAGKKKPYEPQPYAVMEIDDRLFAIKSKQQLRHMGAASFDRERGFLYVFEFRGDEDKCLVHVWHVRPEQ